MGTSIKNKLFWYTNPPKLSPKRKLIVTKVMGRELVIFIYLPGQKRLQ